MTTWISLSVGILATALLACFWRFRWPRWYWSQELDRRVNIVVATVSVVSLVVAVVTLGIAFEALREARSSGGEQLVTLQRSRDALEKVITSLGVQTRLLTDAQTSLSGQLDLDKRQLKVVQSQYAAQNKRPILEVEALIYSPVPGARTFSRALLRTPLPNGPISADVNLLVQSDTRYREASFFIRNVGTSTAINVTVVPRVPISVIVKCIDYPDLYVSAQGKDATPPCSTSSGILPAISPRPQGHRAHMPDSATTSAFYSDATFETKVRVNMVVPIDLPAFELELSVSADGIGSARYVVFCHNLPI
jgi:hypothetical protein